MVKRTTESQQRVVEEFEMSPSLLQRHDKGRYAPSYIDFILLMDISQW